jgi:hypothetical protein
MLKETPLSHFIKILSGLREMQQLLKFLANCIKLCTKRKKGRLCGLFFILLNALNLAVGSARFA